MRIASLGSDGRYGRGPLIKKGSSQALGVFSLRLGSDPSSNDPSRKNLDLLTTGYEAVLSRRLFQPQRSLDIWLFSISV